MTLREKMLAAKFRSEKLTVDLGDGPQEIEVRQPSVREKAEIVKAGGGSDAATMHLGRLQVRATILCARDPQTGALLFQESDAEVLSSLPCGGAIEAIAGKALELMNGDMEAAAKK